MGTWNGGFFSSPIFSLSSEAFLPGFSSHSAGEWPVCPQTKHFSCCPVVVTTCHQPQQLTENQMCITYSKPFNLLVNKWQNKTYTQHSRSHPYQYHTADIKVPLLIWKSRAHVLPEQAWSNLHPAKAHTFLKHQKRVKHQTCKKMLQLLAISSCFRCTTKNPTQGTTMLLQNLINIWVWKSSKSGGKRFLKHTACKTWSSAVRRRKEQAHIYKIAENTQQ